MRKLVTRAANSLLFRARHLACSVPERPFPVLDGRAFISLTFDDFRVSALEKGGAILERHDVRGTFYWTAGANSSPVFADRQHIAALVARGHELGCHSFSHLDCARACPIDLEHDLARNAAAIAQVLPNGPAVEQFAYPYGLSAGPEPSRSIT